MERARNTGTTAALLAEAAWLRRLARRLVDPAAADDVVQETFAAALAAPPQLDRPLRPWLATVLRNFVRLSVRQDERRDRREQATIVEQPLPTSEELLAQHQARRLVALAVEALEEPFRSTVLLCYAEGLEPKEIAARRGEPPGTVRWRLKRGLELLRDRLDAQHGHRRTWLALLVPLTGHPAGRPPAPAPAAPLVAANAGFTLGGLLIMKTKLAVAIGVLALALLLALGKLASSPAPGTPGSAAGPRPESSGTVESLSPPPAPTLPRLADHAGGAGAGANPLAGTIEGTVRDPRGGALGGVAVAAVPRVPVSELGTGRRQIGPAATAMTDAAGRYRIEKLPLEAYAVTASARGFEPAYRSEAVLRADSHHLRGIDLTLVPGGARLSGTVLDTGGGAVAGARVTAIAPVTQTPDLTQAFQATTGSDGRYELHLAGRGRYLLAVDADGYAQTRLPPQNLEGDVTRDITLSPAAQVRGRVVDARGANLAGAAVTIARIGRPDLPFVSSTISDGAGAFAFRGVLAGEHRLWARLGPRSGRLAAALAVKDADHVDGLTVVLQEGRTITGQVRDQTGGPISGVELWFSTEEGAPSQERQAVTGRDGRYRIEGVLPGQYQLSARAPTYRRSGRGGHGAQWRRC